MIKRLLNPHILLKITLILTALLLLPSTAWGTVNFTTSGTPQTITGVTGYQFTWNVNGVTDNNWVISSKSVTTATSTGFTTNLSYASDSKDVTIKGFSRPTSGSCKISKILIDATGSISNCDISMNVGSSSFKEKGTSGSVLEYSPNNETPLSWDATSTITIKFTNNSTTDFTSITVNSITVQLTNIDDTDTEFSWPKTLDGATVSSDAGTSLSVNAFNLPTFSFPLTASSMSRDVEYSSSNTDVATIDMFGKVIIKKIGSSTITATLKDSADYYYTQEKKYTYELNVEFPAPNTYKPSGTYSFGSDINFYYGDGNLANPPTIKYKWNDSEEIKEYNNSLPPKVKDGTITAWAETKNNEDTNIIIKSSELSAKYLAFYLEIGNYSESVKVTSQNAANITGTGIEGDISYNIADNTLSLNNASVFRIHTSSEQDLIININGSNTVGEIVGYGGENNLIQIHKAGESASLEVTGTRLVGGDSMGPIYHFTSCTWGEGLYLNPYHYDQAKEEYLALSGAYYDTQENQFRNPSYSVDRVIFSESQTTVPPSIWIGSVEVRENGTFDDNSDILFDKETNTLTLSGSPTGDIISSLPYLKIKIAEGNISMSTNRIISANSIATLSFETLDNSSLSFAINNAWSNDILPWEGFANDTKPNFSNKLVYIPNNSVQYIKVLSAPKINAYSDGVLSIRGLTDEYNNHQFSYYYTVTYEDGEGSVEKTRITPIPESGYTTTDRDEITLENKPFTIAISAEYTDPMGNKTESAEIIGKYFGFETEELVVPYQATVNAPNVVPALPNGVTKDFSGNELNPIDPETGVITIEKLTQGDPFVYQATFSAPTNNVGYIILNAPYSVSGNSDIQIVESYDLGTFSVAVTKKSLKDVTIKDIPDQTYTGLPITPAIEIMNGELPLTDDDCEIAYSNNTSAGTATVTVTPTETSYYSDSATKTFTITAQSISDATITLADNKTEFTYNESANVPTITRVYQTEGSETTIELTAGTDYTISYVKVNGETEEAIEASNIINVGSYKMILTGKGNFSGIKAVPFSITPRTITNLTFALSATSFTYNGEAQKPTVTVQFEETELEATKGTTKTIPTTDYDLTFSGECINAGTYSVSASLKGNYSGSGDGPSFTITKATISPKVTLDGWTYGTTANTPSVSGNTGNGEVTYAYKLQNEAESAFAAAAPTNAGAYTVKASIAATANYEAASDTAHFTIAKDDITPTVTIEGWTYGSTPNTPEVKGNTGNGAESFTYKAEGADTFSSEVPTAVGTHTVKVTIAETTNYNGGEATATFTIINRTIDAANDIAFAEGQTYASFYSSDEDLELPETGIAVYMITGTEGNTLTTQAVSYIPKATPVLVEKTETAVGVKDPSEVGTNLLQYATEDVTTDGTLYILYNGEYVKATGTIPQGKCYLKPIKPSGSRRLAIGHNNGTTGISDFDAENETDRWYDLNGQRISKPQKKGVYINNGRKIVVK